MVQLPLRARAPQHNADEQCSRNRDDADFSKLALRDPHRHAVKDALIDTVERCWNWHASEPRQNCVEVVHHVFPAPANPCLRAPTKNPLGILREFRLRCVFYRTGI
jgi:hypothetical protein